MIQAELQSATDAATLEALRLKVLHEIDRGILAAESVQGIAVSALSRIRDLVPCERAGIGLFDWEAQEAIVFAAEVDSNEIDTTGVHYPMRELGEMLRTIESGSPFLIRDMAADPIPRVLEPFRDRGLRSCLQVPLAGDGPPIGVLSLMAHRPEAFGLGETRTKRSAG